MLLHRCWLFCLLLLFAVGLITPALAQEVRPSKTGFGSMVRHGDNLADEQNRADWPRLTKDQSGTQIHISTDLRNADVTIVTVNTFGLSRLLDESRRIAEALDLPKTDFITREGTRTVTVDMEFNNYLRKEGKRTEFDLALGELAATLELSALPRPIVFLVDKADITTVTMVRQNVSQSLPGEFYGLKEVAPDTHLRFVSELPWYAPLAATVIASLLAFGFIPAAWMPWWMARTRRKQRQEAAKNPIVASPPAPEEVQKAYNRALPQWILTLAFPILLFVVLGNGAFGKFLTAGMIVLLSYLPSDLASGPGIMLLPIGMAVVYGASSGICWLVERKRNQRDTLPPVLEDEDIPPSWTQTGWLSVMGAMLLLAPLFLFVQIPATWPRGSRLWLYCLYIAVGAVVAITIGILGARKTRTVLGPESEWYVMAHTLAAQAGIRIRQVLVHQSPALNAYANLWGNVGLTSALIRKLEPDEVRAILAHEIGHHKGGHVRRQFILSLVVTALIIAAWIGLKEYLFRYGNLSPSWKAAFNSGLFGIFIMPVLTSLILGRGQRRQEEEADRFAAEATGDPELVIRALVKIHTGNATPHTLKPEDELLATHPSLANRIRALRQVFPTDRRVSPTTPPS